jgi:hypothetical protein
LEKRRGKGKKGYWEMERKENREERRERGEKRGGKRKGITKREIERNKGKQGRRGGGEGEEMMAVGQERRFVLGQTNLHCYH